MRHIKRVISIILITIIFTLNVGATGWYDTLGTGKSLGSPLLDTNFKSNEFSPAEILIFGIFLSNYAVPFVDNYETAYTENSEGSQGTGYEVLKFSSACSDTVLTSLLDVVIANQFTSVRPIYNSDTGNNAVLGDILTKSGGIVSDVTLHVKDSNNNNVVIYDSNDTWDSTMMEFSIAQLSNVNSSLSNIKDLVKASVDGMATSTLYFDRYGNICARDASKEEYVIVYQAAVNQHLTRNKSYNLLTSTFLSGSLIDYDTDNLYFRGVKDSKLTGLHRNKEIKTYILMNGLDDYLIFDDIGLLSPIGDQFYTSIIKSVAYEDESNEDIYKNLMDNDLLTNINIVVRYRDNIWTNGNTSKNIQLNLGSNVLNFMFNLNGTKINMFSDDFDIVAQRASYYGNTGIAGINTLYKYLYELMSSESRASDIGLSKNTIINAFRSGTLFGDSYSDSSYEGRKIIDSYIRNYLAANGLSDNNQENLDKILEYVFAEIQSKAIYKIISKSNVLEKVEEILDLNDHSSQYIEEYIPYVYLTYLKWYGLISSDYNVLNTELFNVECSDINEDDIKNIVSNTGNSEEEAKENITELFADGESGAEARAEYTSSTIGNTIYSWYKKIVNSNNTGFLTVRSLEDNAIIGGFMGIYADNVIGFIAICLVVMVIIMIFKRRNFSWLFITLITIVNIAILMPSISEILPLVSQTAIEKIFSTKADEWALAETASNSTIYDSLTDELGVYDGTAAYELIKDINSIYSDRSLVLKQDISKKVNGTENELASQILKYRSTQWLLPRIMRQYSDDTDRYVYVTYDEVARNAQKLYWLYNESARIADGAYGESTNSTDMNNVHTEMYKIDEITELNSKLDFTEILKILRNKELTEAEQNEQIDAMVENVLNNYGTNNFLTSHSNLVVKASTYDMDGYEADKAYGYLWTTESLYSYFYASLRDKFGNNISINDLKNYLLGYDITVEVNDETGSSSNVINIMGDDGSEDVDSIVDLKHLISDVIPYMYTAQLIAGGVNGDTGVFDGSKLVNYNIYKDNDAAWLYRCNWVTKIVENRYINNERDKGLDVTQYENGNIITSDFERESLGKEYSELSSLERKLININNAIYKRCVLLLNSISIEDLTVSDLVKQMALIATTEFNKGINGYTYIFNSNKLYPTSIDLRNVSIESILRLVILNSTNDYSIVYGDPVKNIINNSDIFSAIMLLIASWICVFLIPLISDIIMALIFILGIAAMVVNVIGDVKVKAKVTMAYIMDIGLFILINIAYYGLIACLINVGDIIKISNGGMQFETPVLAIIMLLVITLLYVWISWICITYMFKNWKDAGYGIISKKLNVVADGIKGTLTGLFNVGISEEEASEIASGAGRKSNESKIGWFKSHKKTDMGYRDNTEKKSEVDKRVKTKDNNIKMGINESETDTMNVKENEEEVKKERKKINDKSKGKKK